MASNFIPPIPIGQFKPSSEAIASWLYEVWKYLQENPIPASADVSQQAESVVQNYVSVNVPPMIAAAIAGLEYSDLVNNTTLPVYRASNDEIDNQDLLEAWGEGCRFALVDDESFFIMIKNGETINLLQVLTEQQSAGVISVNGYTGNVVLKVSDLANDVGYLTANSQVITSLEDNVSAMLPSTLGTEIAANTNITTITSVGRYYSPSGVRTGTLSGLPGGIEQVGFRMEITKVGSIFRREIYTGSTNYPQIFVQDFSSASVYSSWKQIKIEDVSGTTITKEIYGCFKATEVIADSIYFKIVADEILQLPTNVTFSFSFKSITGNNTGSGMYVSSGINDVSTGWTFNTPYIGGQRTINIKADKTAHGLTGNAVLNIPPANAIVMTYVKP